MKKNSFILCAFALLFASCKHEPIIPDAEYFNGAAYDKIAEYWNGYTPSQHNVFGIYFQKDTTGQEQLVVTAHINYNHTLDSMSVNQSPWMKLSEHYGNFYLNTTLSSRFDQTVAFQIRSKTPKEEIMTGEVTIPKQMPITATDLGNNTFKIKWTPQNRRERVLLHLTYFRVYVQRLNNAYAIETEDDGEFILAPSVFAQFKELPSQFPSPVTTETVKVGLLRIVSKRKTVVKQASTGTEYSVFGGAEDLINIEVLK